MQHSVSTDNGRGNDDKDGIAKSTNFQSVVQQKGISNMQPIFPFGMYNSQFGHINNPYFPLFGYDGLNPASRMATQANHDMTRAEKIVAMARSLPE